MKEMTKKLVLVFIAFAFSAATFAQVSATANASATIITPITITKVVGADMNFRNIAVNATPGTVVLTPGGTRSLTGGCTLPASAGTVTAAAFTVTGLAAATYSITLPGVATTIVSGANNMTVDTWTSTPNASGTLAGGTDNLTVGATLHVGASQAAGTYTSADPFSVTVNYNLCHVIR